MFGLLQITWSISLNNDPILSCAVMQPSSSQQPTTDAIDYDRELTRLQSQYNQSDGISVLPEMMRLLLSAGSEASSITSKLHKLHR